MAYIPTFFTLDNGESSRTIRTAGRLEHPDLITLLAAAQRNCVEFVPIIRQEALGLLGKGGTAEISQAMVNLERSFAFKDTSRHRAIDIGDSGRPKGPYEILTLELSILTHPVIRNHPNIVDIEGICWEITKDDHVYPVLLFEKAEHRDLLQFSPSLQAGITSFDAKLSLCIDIARGIYTLHIISKSFS
jgi:hypothetical protein